MLATDPRPVILVCNGAYWPGNDASGVNQSLPALAQALQGEFRFRFLARDRPFGADTPIVTAGSWRDIDFAQVRYCSPGVFGVAGLAALLRETPHDLLVLNGFFDRDFTIPALVFRRMGVVARKPVIVSPRGEFSLSALSLKDRRKSAWLTLARQAGLLRDVTLHGTSDDEIADIRRGAPFAGRYAVAGNVRAPVAVLPHEPASDGRLRVAFIGRISRVKNLDLALAALRQVPAPVAFSIYGPVEDETYWAECEALIEVLPNHSTVEAKGQIAAADIPAALAETDLFFLPSKSENFGHAIFEALACGVPVLIGDQTPWRQLAERRAGWELPLNDPDRYAAKIHEFAAMPESERQLWRLGARQLADEALVRSEAVAQSRDMLQAALALSAMAAPVRF